MQEPPCIPCRNPRVNPARATRTGHTFSPEPPFPTLVMPLFHTHYSRAHAESHAQILSISPFSRSDSDHSVYIEKILHILQKICTFSNPTSIKKRPPQEYAKTGKAALHTKGGRCITVSSEQTDSKTGKAVLLAEDGRHKSPIQLSPQPLSNRER